MKISEVFTKKALLYSKSVKSLILAVSLTLSAISQGWTTTWTKIDQNPAIWDKTLLPSFIEDFDIPFNSDAEILPDYPFNYYYNNNQWLFDIDGEIFDKNYPARTFIYSNNYTLRIRTNFEGKAAGDPTYVAGSLNEIILRRQEKIKDFSRPFQIRTKIQMNPDKEIPYCFWMGFAGETEGLCLGWDDYKSNKFIKLWTQETTYSITSITITPGDTIDFSFELRGTTVSYCIIQNTTTLAEGIQNVNQYSAKDIQPIIYTEHCYTTGYEQKDQEINIQYHKDSVGKTSWQKEDWKNVNTPSSDENKRILATLQRQDFEVTRSTVWVTEKNWGTGADEGKFWFLRKNFFDESGAYILFTSEGKYVSVAPYLKIENGALKLFPCSSEAWIMWDNKYFFYNAHESTITATGEFTLPNNTSSGKVALGFYTNSEDLCILIWDGQSQEWQIYYWTDDVFKTIAFCPTLQAGKYKLLISLFESNVYYEIWKDDNLQYSGNFNISPAPSEVKFCSLCPAFFTYGNTVDLDWIEWWKGDKNKWKIETPK